MENQPMQANTQSMGYSIVFSPDKPQVPVPKCVTEYKSKPADSPGMLQRKLHSAAERRKEGEQARLVRIQQRDEAVTEFDKRVRPYIDALLQEDSGTKSQTENATGATQH